MAKRLTAKSVEQLKPRAERLEIPDAGTGLRLIIQPSGAKSWAIRYRHNGRTRKHTLGPYPRIDLSAARAAASAALALVDRGKDPASERREARRRQQAGLSNRDVFETAFEEFQSKRLTKRSKRRPAERTLREHKNLFRREIMPKWRKRRLSEITDGDVRDLIDGIVARGAPITANRTLAALKTFFNWCARARLIQTSPCKNIDMPAAEASRERALTDDEIRWLWRAAEKDGQPFGPLFQLLLLTGTRRDEVRAMVEAELLIDDRIWAIPGNRTKNGRAHHVPLADATLAVLAAVKRVKNKKGYLFTTTGENPVSGMSRAKARIDRLMIEVAREEAVQRGDDPAKIEFEPWRLHDLRRTLATGLQRLGFSIEICEAALNHKSGVVRGVAAVYARHDYRDEKREALTLWARHIERVVSDDRRANVVELRSAAVPA